MSMKAGAKASFSESGLGCHYLSDVQNLLCVVVCTLPNEVLSCFLPVDLIAPEGFLHFAYLVFTVVTLPLLEVLAVAHLRIHSIQE